MSVTAVPIQQLHPPPQICPTLPPTIHHHYPPPPGLINGSHQHSHNPHSLSYEVPALNTSRAGRASTAPAGLGGSRNRLLVNLTRGTSNNSPGVELLLANGDGTSDGIERRVTFQLPPAPTPKPLSAARRHIKPPDPAPLSKVFTTDYRGKAELSHPHYHPVPASSSVPIPSRQLINWGPDDIDIAGQAVGKEKIVGRRKGWEVSETARKIGTQFASKENSRGDGASRPNSAKRDKSGSSSLPNTAINDLLQNLDPVADNPSVYVPKPATLTPPGVVRSGSASSSRTQPTPGNEASASVAESRIYSKVTTPRGGSARVRPSTASGVQNLAMRESQTSTSSDSFRPTTAEGDFAPAVHNGPNLMDFTALHRTLPLTQLPGSLTRTQTVRSNIDRMRIEQIALRRLRYVIESYEAEPEHLAVVDLIDHVRLPSRVLQHYFGPSYKTVHDVRVLLLQAIDRTKRLREASAPGKPDNNHESGAHHHEPIYPYEKDTSTDSTDVPLAVRKARELSNVDIGTGSSDVDDSYDSLELFGAHLQTHRSQVRGAGSSDAQFSSPDSSRSLAQPGLVITTIEDHSKLTPPNRPPPPILAPRPPVTTPEELLIMLDQVENAQAQAAKKRRGNTLNYGNFGYIPRRSPSALACILGSKKEPRAISPAGGGVETSVRGNRRRMTATNVRPATSISNLLKKRSGSASALSGSKLNLSVRGANVDTALSSEQILKMIEKRRQRHLQL
ncbi:hypothetical protein DFS34DRAFT_591074 [Phlyctochytrium arcticum]|nr:hypothetical protein DFS34DRAFT_591074 [Phlyctochytrium arcticum]